MVQSTTNRKWATLVQVRRHSTAAGYLWLGSRLTAGVNKVGDNTLNYREISITCIRLNILFKKSVINNVRIYKISNLFTKLLYSVNSLIWPHL